MNLKPLSSKTHFLLSPSPSSSPFPYSIIVSYFCSSLPTTHSRSHSFRRQHEEESKNVRVSVWWDFENCNLPAGVNVFKVAHAITAAIRANGIKGPIQITAFGDVQQLSRSKQEALSSTGINLTHIPHGGKNSADRSLLVDLMYWVSQNPPPAHLFLISGDRDFASVLHRLRMNNYNILLASTDTAPSVLCSAASIMWRWNALVRGENLTGKIFNQPPDGPYGSWYGHYKMPLEDPFSVVEQSTCSQGEEFTEACSETKVRPIPKAVMKQICNILSLYPKGISITELRSELGKSNVVFDKDFYGYKKFSLFLLSMPNILKLQLTGDGKFLVSGIAAKPEPVEPNPCSSTVISNGNQQSSWPLKPNAEDIPISEAVDKKSVMPSSPELSTKGPTGKVQQSPLVEKAVKMDIEQPPKEIEEPPSIGKKVVEVTNDKVAEDNLLSVKEQDSKSEMGFFKKIWRRWFGSNDDSSGIKGYDLPKNSHTSGDNSAKNSENTLEKSGTLGESLEKKEADKKIVKTPIQENVQVPPTSCSSPNSESTLGKETCLSSEPYSEKSGKGPGLLNRIMTLCKLGRNTLDSNSSVDQSCGELKQITSYSERHQIFSKDSFWRDMESFLDSLRGSLLVSQSRTREQMARNLQKEGPVILRSLDETDVLWLVDMLISEKKWVEEYPSEASPFKLTLSVGKNTSTIDPRASNGLRSIFLSTPLQSDSKRRPERDGDGRTGRIQNISHAGVSQPVSCKKPSERSRRDTLIDCQKLVNEILKDFPGGYNISSFRKLFLDRYRYQLDIQKLGYQKLASLLQIMPGVKIESTYIIPSSKVRKCSIQDSAAPNIQESNVVHTSETSGSELTDASKDVESDSIWEELGPVDNTGSRRKEAEEKCTFPHYESSISDDDFSDSEGEPSAVTQLEGQSKAVMIHEDSSLLQILDSWYASNESDNRKDKSENVQGMVDCSKTSLQPSDTSGLGTKIDTSLGNYGQKKRPQRSYSFVADPADNNPNKLIDGVMGSLKKSGGSKMQS